MVSWPDGRSVTSHAEEGRGSYEQSAGESQDGVICRLGQQRVNRRWPWRHGTGKGERVR